MAKLRVIFKPTGEEGILDTDVTPFDPERYELIQEQPQQPTAQPQEQKSLLGSIGSGAVGIGKSMVEPFTTTGKHAGGALYELLRAGADKVGVKDVYYDTQSGQTVQNPFLTENELQEFSIEGDNPLERVLNIGMTEKGRKTFTDKAVRPAAGVMSYGVPFGKGASTLSRAVLPGATAGGMFAYSKPDAGVEEVIGGAVVGGVTAGVFDKLASKWAQGKPGKMGRELQASARGSRRAGTTPSMRNKANAMWNKYFKSGSASSQWDQTDDVLRQLSDDIDDVLKVTKSSASKTKVVNNVGKLAKDSKYYTPETPLIDKEIARLLKKMSGSTKSKNIDAKQIFAFKKWLNSQYGPAAKKIAANKTLTARDAAIASVRDVLDDEIIKVAPKVKDLTITQSLVYQLRDDVGKKADKLIGFPLLQNLVNFNKPVTAAQSMIGRGMEKSAGVLGNILSVGGSPTAQKLGAIGAVDKLGGIGSQQPTQEGVTGDLTGTGGYDYDSLLSQIDSPAPDVFQELAPQTQQISYEQLQQVMLHPDISDKTKGRIIQIYKLQPGGSMDATTRNKLSEATASLKLVDEIEGLWNDVASAGYAGSEEEGQLQSILSRQVAKGKGAIAQQEAGGPVSLYEDVKQAFLSKISRASGEKGVLTDQDIKRIEKALPTIGDSPQKAAKKLQTLRNILGSAVETNIDSAMTPSIESVLEPGYGYTEGETAL